MKILQVHNYYRLPGGEDRVVCLEKKMLTARGHRVIRFTRDNRRIDGFSPIKKAGLFFSAAWARDSCRDLAGMIRQERPDIAHFHNTVPLISAAAYHVCQKLGVPVVQTVHNYRAICPSAVLFREGRICRECRGRAMIPALRHGCYRGSRTQTAALVAAAWTHSLLGTMKREVDAFIALSPQMKGILTDAGLPAAKITVKPNFSDRVRALPPAPSGHALFLGRLSPEKGLSTLIRAWMDVPTLPLKIAGQGPLDEKLRREAQGLAHVEFTGHVAGRGLMDLTRQSRFIIHASECLEGFPMAIVEAFSLGRAVLSSAIGTGASMVVPQETGLAFAPGNAADLAHQANWLARHPDACTRMGRNARAVYETCYSEKVNYPKLMDIYNKVIKNRHGRQ